MTSQIIPFTSKPPATSNPVGSGHFRYVAIDGEYALSGLGEDMPPELFDDEEDREELALYVHMAELSHDE